MSENPYEGWSDGDITASIEQQRAELDRRLAVDEHERTERQRKETEEVKAGTRLARREHILQMTPAETAALVESGKLAHLGIGASRRRGQR